MRELSVFVDESGNLGGTSKYYLLTLVFHDQNEQIEEQLQRYECELSNRGMANVVFHLGPLLHGDESYEMMTTVERSRQLMGFSAFTAHMPFRYKTLCYIKNQFADSEALSTRMRRDLINFLFDQLEFIQAYDVVKLYYDNGQPFITKVLHQAFEYILTKDFVVYRDVRPAEYRLFQIADFVCGIELEAIKYENSESSSTDRTFFGSNREFKKNYLKKVRKKLIE